MKLNKNKMKGMATALPSKDEKVNEIASNSIRSDKEWEAK